MQTTSTSTVTPETFRETHRPSVVTPSPGQTRRRSSIHDATRPVPALVLDHPGWLTDGHGHARRAFTINDTLWTVTREPTNAMLTANIDITQPTIIYEHPIIDWFDPTILPSAFRSATLIRDGIRICRIRNPSIWDALIPPILHQRRTVTEAAKQYRRLCAAHGRTITSIASSAHLPPHPETVATLPDDAFFELGMRGKQEHLRTAAEAYLRHADHWASLSPAELFTELQTVTYIGAATAGAAVADLTNDYSFCTIPAHTAYHHWQKLVADPGNTPTQDDFTTAWTHLTQEQRSTLIVVILTGITLSNTNSDASATIGAARMSRAAAS